jgi:hypothetical protein
MGGQNNSGPNSTVHLATSDQCNKGVEILRTNRQTWGREILVIDSGGRGTSEVEMVLDVLTKWSSTTEGVVS